MTPAAVSEDVGAVDQRRLAIRQRTRRYLVSAQPVIALILTLVAWEIVVKSMDIASWMLPAPTSVFEQLVVRWSDLLSHGWFTLRVTLIGFGIAVAFGIVLAIAVVYSRLLQNTIMPLLVVSQAIPKVALAPLLLIWVGYGQPSAVAVASLIAFFPMVVDSAAGLRSVQPEVIDLSRSLAATKVQTFRKVVFPSALPHVFSGAKIAVTLALVGAVIGEFVGSDAGLGHIILLSTSYLNTSLSFAAIFALSAIGIALFYSVHLAERLLCSWAEYDL